MTETHRLNIAYDDPGKDGWIVARVVEVPGAISQGRAMEEARSNMIDALRLMLAPDDDRSRVIASWCVSGEGAYDGHARRRGAAGRKDPGSSSRSR